MEEPGEKPQPAGAEESPSHPARELSLHMLRMLETRLDAAGIVLNSESQRLVSRLQWALLAAATMFIAVWGGIVLLAIALPPALRVPVLSGVVAAFVITAVVAFVLARRMVPGRKVGSLAWFLEGLKLDLEVLARSLSQSQPQSAPPPEQQRKPPDDIAA
jgi:uncharacterized membrane protein YqjE